LEPFAVGRALFADFGALATHLFVAGRPDEHEGCRRPTDFGACHHQTEMSLLDVFATHFEAMAHRGRKTYLMAVRAGVDAALHL